MLARTGLTILLASLLCGAVAWTPGDGDPTFSNPTEITNSYAPFVPGSVKVFRGKSEGLRTAALETHLQETRVFDWDGQQVECRIVEEKEFEDGALVEIALNYLAQDDAGNVRFFGEVSSVYENGAVVEVEEDSWLVGGPTLPTDPPGVFAADAPTMFMIADPQLGDSFQQEGFNGLDETLTVVGTGLKVKVPAGHFAQGIKLQELDDGEDGGGPGPPEHRWVVPGVGVVREKAKDGHSELLATSLLEQQPGS